MIKKYFTNFSLTSFCYLEVLIMLDVMCFTTFSLLLLTFSTTFVIAWKVTGMVASSCNPATWRSRIVDSYEGWWRHPVIQILGGHELWIVMRDAHHEAGQISNEEFTTIGQKIHEGEIKIQPNESVLLKVMQYNVLSQDQLESHPYLYKDHDVNALNWENRWPLIYKKIKDEDPQILCLQEVDPMYMFSHYTQLLELGYNWVFKKNSGPHEDGVAVFYKSDLFKVESHSEVELNQGIEPLTAHKTGVIVQLRVKLAPNPVVVVATTHLLYNPNRSDTRLGQAQVMLAEIDRLAYNRNLATYYPVIFTGDLNLQPHTGVYRYLTEGQLKFEGLSRKTLEPSLDNSTSLSRELLSCSLGVTDKSQHIDVLEARLRGEDVSSTKLNLREFNTNPQDTSDNCSKDSRFSSGKISHKLNLRSAYPHPHHSQQEQNQLGVTTKHNGNWITVDYIFYSTTNTKEAISKEPLELVSWERLPTQKDLTTHNQHIPNSHHGSDHFPLTASFLLHLNWRVVKDEDFRIPSSELLVVDPTAARLWRVTHTLSHVADIHHNTFQSDPVFSLPVFWEWRVRLS